MAINNHHYVKQNLLIKIEKKAHLFISTSKYIILHFVVVVVVLDLIFLFINSLTADLEIIIFYFKTNWVS